MWGVESGSSSPIGMGSARSGFPLIKLTHHQRLSVDGSSQCSGEKECSPHNHKAAYNIICFAANCAKRCISACMLVQGTC